MQNGCDHIHLDTFDFQARDFYEKNDFQIFGIMEDYPIGHKRYYLEESCGAWGRRVLGLAKFAHQH